MSPMVKEVRTSVNICRSYGQESNVLFFYSRGVLVLVCWSTLAHTVRGTQKLMY